MVKTPHSQPWDVDFRPSAVDAFEDKERVVVRLRREAYASLASRSDVTL
jgi:hypothetical protein